MTVTLKDWGSEEFPVLATWKIGKVRFEGVYETKEDAIRVLSWHLGKIKIIDKTSSGSKEHDKEEYRMNQQRRKRVQEAFDLLWQVKDLIEEVRDEEQEAHDNLPESFQYGRQGEAMEEWIDMLDTAYDYLDEAQDVLEQITGESE